MRSVHLEIIGDVQGVGFRWFVREAARRRGLAGWVKNRTDGSVELATSGDDDKVTAFVQDVRRGPRGARVERVTELAHASLGALVHPFEIRQD